MKNNRKEWKKWQIEEKMQKNEQYRKIRKKGKIMKNREKEGKKYEQ